MVVVVGVVRGQGVVFLGSRQKKWSHVSLDVGGGRLAHFEPCDDFAYGRS